MAPRPVLLAVDDDPAALEAVERQLTQRYARDYRVECIADAGAAVRALAAFAQGGEEVALLLAASSLPDLVGAELFERSRRLHPDAKRALLVPAAAWTDADTGDAIRGAMALGQIDFYVSKPGDGPDEVFHEAVASFLLEWARDRRLVPQTVHIVGESWAGRAYELRKAFERCAVPHLFSLASSERGREVIARAGPGAKLPLMALPDGRVLSDPTNAAIAEAAGAPARFDDELFDVVIVGAGPAGLSAAVYGASEGLRVLVVDEAGIGGQARSSSLIRNYLGFAKGISGSRLAEQAYEQARVFGAEFVFMHRVRALSQSDELALTLADDRRVRARAVILATGATYRRVGVPALEGLHGAGVYYGGTVSEAPGLHGKHAYIVGGANSAGQAALHLARYARRVTLVVRAPSLDAGMSDYLVRAVEATPNIDVRTRTTVVGGHGEERLHELVLRESSTGVEQTVEADALFVMIGARPRTGWLPDGVARDENGFLLTGSDLPECDWPLARPPLSHETSIPGVFAVGDVRHGSVKRVASAVGEGAIAIQLVQALFTDERQLV